MKAGDILTCKKTYYSDSGGTFKSKVNNMIFKKPLFKKGQKYKLINIRETSIQVTGSTYSIQSSPSYNIFEVEGCIYALHIDFMKEMFYSLREERKMKLEKIKKRYVI